MSGHSTSAEKLVEALDNAVLLSFVTTIEVTLHQALRLNQRALRHFGPSGARINPNEAAWRHERSNLQGLPRKLREILTMRKIAIIVASIAFLLGLTAVAQESRSEISLQGTGVFTQDTTGHGTTERSTNSGGFLVGYRYNFNRWLAAEAVYGYNRNTQQYFAPTGLSRIQANVHQATGGFVFRVPTPARFRISPYVLAEGGALVFDPTSNAFGTVPGAQRQATGVFAYGGGADFPIVRHVALRAEYRGLVYNAPDFGLTALNTNTITHTAQPSAGIVFRF